MNEEKYINTLSPAIYFKSLEFGNVKCFKNGHEIDLSDGNGKPAQWTVLLGNNNTGKTTILRCLAGLEAKRDTSPPGREDLITFSPKSLPEDMLTKDSKISCSFFYCENSSLNDFISLNNYSYEYLYGLNHTSSTQYNLKNLIVYGYGTSRRLSKITIEEAEKVDTSKSLFNDNIEFLNIEEWIVNVYFTSINITNEHIEKARLRFNKIKDVLTKGILPDVNELRIISKGDYNYVEFKTDYGWVRLKDLGYRYQASITWIGDLIKRMFDRYPDVDNPLEMPAIVLVDEIDLHLHPQWQRKIIGFLSDIFPNTQFIVTAHSPLIVQSADNINLVILRHKKGEDFVTIEQPKIKTFKGWSVEEILSELMDMGDKTYSEAYLKLMDDFDEALDEENYEKAQTAYKELDKILHPESSQRKLLRIQMSSLVPATQT
jgi:predicted ATP-binding protein involved in virulence